jgi:hypothetical protein
VIVNQLVNIAGNVKDTPTGQGNLSGQPVSGAIANKIVIEESATWKDIVLQEHPAGRIEFRLMYERAAKRKIYAIR